MMNKLIKILIIINMICFKKLDLKIFYESLCPPSINAISLISSTIKMLGGFEAVGNIHFIPFGFGTIKNNRIIKCQHGEQECYGNKLHACANKLLPLGKANEFIACTILKVTHYIDQNKGVFYRQIKDLCFVQNKINNNKKIEIEKCARGVEIEKFMIENYHSEFRKHKVEATPHFIFNNIDTNVINLMVAHKPLILFCDFLENKPQFCKIMRKNLAPKKSTKVTVVHHSKNDTKKKCNKNKKK